MDTVITKELIRKLPKVDLHLHLDGCVKPETALELASTLGIPLPASEKELLLPYMQVTDDCGSLKEYLSKFDFTTPFLQTGDALKRVAREAVEQAAEHSCGYIEVRFAPQLHRKMGLSVDETMYWVTEGLKQGEARCGVKARAIAICMRNHSQQANREVVEAAARFLGQGVVAVDLAGDEASFPAELFRDTFALARKHGIPITIHAGEAAGPANIYEAVTRLGAVRIGHGVRLQENPEVLEIVRERNVPLELCPVSNIQTKAVSGWEAYPIKQYFEQGLTLTVNTDNPTVSGTTITQEYQTIAEKFHFTLHELAAIVMNGVDAAFLEPREKRILKADFKRKLGELQINVL
ncbi:adenosine deaminase [Paenibacillus validus]|uniref:adenosine deaminase n=1 Tax=Paenibacillus validus TaxID=44253 RepID=UPI000FDA579F|nr:adenosine deaminase [Paenibacillus validus]MED4600403.1 adenosine deaminase [Paenibacillus validus]MED4607878.1 adenosine deaminase [Paenibacillus validus]